MYTLDRNPHYPRKYCSQPTIPNRASNDRTSRKSPGALTTPNRRFKTMRIIHRINRKTPGALTTPIRESISRDFQYVNAASIGSL